QIERGSHGLMILDSNRDRLDTVVRDEIEFRSARCFVGAHHTDSPAVNIDTKTGRIEKLSAQYDVQGVSQQAPSYVGEIGDCNSLVLERQSHSLQGHAVDQHCLERGAA